MGIDYGFDLYLPTHTVGRALRAAASIAREEDGPVEIVVPGGERLAGAACLVLDREGDGDEVCWPAGGGDLATRAASWPEVGEAAGR